MRHRLWTMAAMFTLAGCGGSDVRVPEQFAGTWGADCSAPWVKFSDGTVHDFPGKADYPLKAAALDGATLTVTYTRPDGEVTDTYVGESDTIKLTKTVMAGGGEADWDKAPMRKCP